MAARADDAAAPHAAHAAAGAGGRVARPPPTAPSRRSSAPSPTRARSRARSSATASPRRAVRTEGQALVHLLFLASLRGLVVRGPMVGRQHAYVLVRDWLGEPAPVDRDARSGRARAPLPRRPRPGDRPRPREVGGPAAARRSRRARGDRLRARATAATASSNSPAARRGRPPPAAPARRLRPGAARLEFARAVWSEHMRVVTVSGIFRPFAMVGGRAVATWRLAATGWSSSRSAADHARSPRPSTPTRPPSCASWPVSRRDRKDCPRSPCRSPMNAGHGRRGR